MIEHVEIHNFKGIQHLELKNLKMFNVLVGKNDAGKSSILEAIYAIKATLMHDPREFNPVLRNYLRKQHGRELWFNHQTSNDPTIRITSNGVDFNLVFRSNFSFDNIRVSLDIHEKGTVSFTCNSFFENFGNYTNQDLMNSLEGNIRLEILQMQFIHEMFAKDTKKWEENVDVKNIDYYDTNVSSLRSTDYVQNERRLSLIKNGVSIFLDSYGDGHKSGLALLNIVSMVENTTILVEEIESHQHPSSLRNIIQQFIHFCETRNIQSFITTHSPEVVQLFANANGSEIYHLVKSKDQSIIANNVQENDLNMIKDLGWAISDYLRFEKFVIVEGNADQAILRHAMFKHHGFWPHEVGITIISSGGKDSKQKELLKALSYDGKQVFIQRDLDDSSENSVIQSVCGSFKELIKESPTSRETGEEITVTSKDGTVKKLLRKNILVVGLPEKFPQLKKYAMDDYVLLMLEKDGGIISNLGGDQTKFTTIGENSKNIIENMFGRYDSELIESIIKNSTSIPDELTALIKRILD